MVILVCIHVQDVVQLSVYKHVVTKSGDKQILHLKQTKTDEFALHCEHICFFISDGLTGPLLYVNTFSSLCLQCSFCRHSVFSVDGRWCQCFTRFWYLSDLLVSIRFYLLSAKKVWLGLVSHWTKLCPLLQMWCSSSTFTNAGSIESIPTGSTSSVPAE